MDASAVYSFIVFMLLLNRELCHMEGNNGNQQKIVDINLHKFFTDQCTSREIIQSCKQLASCLASNVLVYAKETNAQCVKENSEIEPSGDENLHNNHLRCNLAPTAFVTLEKIREFLMESDSGLMSPNSDLIKSLCTSNDLDVIVGDDHASMTYFGGVGHSSAENELMFKQVAAYHKFFASAGQYLREDKDVSQEIFQTEFNRNIRALTALVVSFGLPGLFSLCEPSHLKTTLFLQILSLGVVSFYQFIRKGVWWTLLSVGACLVVLVVQFGLLYLVRSRHRPEKPIVLRE